MKNLKPVGMRTVTALLLLVVVSTWGCGQVVLDVTGINRHVDVFGVQLYASKDYPVIDGVVAQREPCMLGYEYQFDPLDVTISYTHGGVVRSLTTRNASTSIYGIRPGADLADSAQRLKALGFWPGERSDTYVDRRLMVTLLADEHKNVFGVRIEVINGP